jgi:hypothetical protein
MRISKDIICMYLRWIYIACLHYFFTGLLVKTQGAYLFGVLVDITRPPESQLRLGIDRKGSSTAVSFYGFERR